MSKTILPKSRTMSEARRDYIRAWRAYRVSISFQEQMRNSCYARFRVKKYNPWSPEHYAIYLEFVTNAGVQHCREKDFVKRVFLETEKEDFEAYQRIDALHIRLKKAAKQKAGR